MSKHRRVWMIERWEAKQWTPFHCCWSEAHAAEFIRAMQADGYKVRFMVVVYAPEERP